MAKEKKEPKKTKKANLTDAPVPPTAATLISDGATVQARYVKDLPVPMNADEAEEAAKEFAHAYRLREEALEARREAMSEHRKTLDGIDERMKELAEGVEKGTKRVAVDVVELLTRAGDVRIIRCDTGEILEERAATAEERQPPLFPEGDANGAPAGDEAH